jgi:transcriptional regulator with XRE-family HTH domain
MTRTMTMKSKRKLLKLIKDKELRNKFVGDNLRTGLQYQLRSLRESQNLTQKQLAGLIGTKQSVISRVERNPERVSIPTLLDLAEAFDVGVVVRFESIDSVLDWYSNSSQKKMTPRKSEVVLNELESKDQHNQIIVDSQLLKEMAEATFKVVQKMYKSPNFTATAKQLISDTETIDLGEIDQPLSANNHVSLSTKSGEASIN